MSDLFDDSEESPYSFGQTGGLSHYRPPLRVTSNEFDCMFSPWNGEGEYFKHSLFTVYGVREWTYNWDYCDYFELYYGQRKKPVKFGPFKNQSLAMQKLKDFMVKNELVQIIEGPSYQRHIDERASGC